MSKRRTLTNQEHQLVKIYIDKTNTSYLNRDFQKMFQSIASQYETFNELSCKQITVLKKAKYKSDMSKRARYKREFDNLAVSQNIDAKLDLVFNPINR